MSTTNDKQAKYGEQPKEREPMLSDEQIDKLAFATPPKQNIYQWGSAAIRDFYEHLITTGKLRVVEEVEVQWSADGYAVCPSCNAPLIAENMDDKYCRECGAAFTQ